MRFFPIFLTALWLVSPAAEAEAEDTPRVVESASQQEKEQERRLDDLACTFEDVVLALSAVEDMTDADLVASRVAVDFLLLRDINAALEEVARGGEVSPDFARSFTTRCAAARQAAHDAMERLRESRCYESDALPAALSLASLMNGSPEGAKLREAGLELVANNLEMLLLLLDEVQDASTADQVALLVMTSFTYDSELTRFAREQEAHEIEQETFEYLMRRIEGARLDLLELLAQLEEKDFFNSTLLKNAMECRKGNDAPNP